MNKLINDTFNNPNYVNNVKDFYKLVNDNKGIIIQTDGKDFFELIKLFEEYEKTSCVSSDSS